MTGICRDCRWWDTSSDVTLNSPLNHGRWIEDSWRVVPDLHECRFMPATVNKRGDEWCAQFKPRTPKKGKA